LRIGFLLGPPGLIHEARALRHALLRHAPTILQETVALFLGLGHYDAHLRRLGRAMATRRALMRQGIAHRLPGLAVPETRAGTSFWLTGPPGFDSDALARDMASQGVILDPGRIFHMAQDNSRSFRLGFAAIRPERIDEGLRLIGQALG
jgi:GntR family transcriptional regulator/MocR family aminotransferase